MKRTSFIFLPAPLQECFAGMPWLNMKNSSENQPDKKERVPLEDAPFTIMVFAITSFTLIAFVLVITLWVS
ncbi:hypothetical protein KQH34_02720 [Erwinia amylovora]|uniref:Uncharacterized protein n=4 Tax=Erwinia amylovora TaxID=552 RepID=A0A831EQ96_ERWAM|nr:hypothetical protein EaACW_1432 [Erwinia amylovora ACW56400]MBZ2387919.1 hypothetical protein [Erwinia amylovora]CBJ46089.1 hypothetical protein EAM_1414 [Erwinia amylovora ATCC 49946]CBX80285.1 hypothetical protein EAIL5_1465 [Erwinia amylovora ATCC BAA-2158]CCO78280.1 hypothetical protein BN432_1476 [Erwinia amylovora Ea356]CCO82069.1 hypothetical protein BN433_1491 [Erwinia amylovora Ea266]CCO85865.1 hypothetical protein BN434_1471 [Erwinia amylovora CFBP 2585]CCO89652.1 hypothetical p